MAAVDMHGRSGSMRRRRIIRAEFLAAALGCPLLGILCLLAGGVWLVLGVWLLGIGANYIALALAAVNLSQSGALEAELAGLDIGSELTLGTGAQLWILVPLALCIGALARSEA